MYSTISYHGKSDILTNKTMLNYQSLVKRTLHLHSLGEVGQCGLRPGSTSQRITTMRGIKRLTNGN